MKLKKDIDLKTFFESVRTCQGEVGFLTADKDRLNLRSALCFFVFTAAFRANAMTLEGELTCELKEDATRLMEFCESG